ncbi:hypothetical protein K438DRAFT_1843331 [Mycena galopus ATCC 62051]|nr:hypothetical protein K438DRAFT_1843331 [Mycena galopus ATCC 62051]
MSVEGGSAQSAPAYSGDGFTSPLLPSASQIAQLRRILRSNTLPPETSTFWTTISATPIDLERYDTEIDRVPSDMSRLTSERHILVSYADECRSAFSPIRRLPVELLAKVFQLCWPDERSGLTCGEAEILQCDSLAMRHLLQLAQVSSFWYCIAMGTPKLWSTLAINTFAWGSRHLLALSLLQSSLNRGGDHALTLDIGVAYHHRKAVCKLLSQHAHRWQHVTFWSGGDDVSKYFGGAKGNLSRLVTLQIPSTWIAADIFRDAPSLTGVSLVGGYKSNTIPRKLPVLPWAQIHTFTYHLFDHADSLSFLRDAKKLVNCEIMFNVREISSAAGWDPCSSDVPCISFRCRGEDAGVVGRIFDSFTLPRLASFSFMSPYLTSAPIWSQHNFLALADRSQFENHLTSLEIQAIITDEELLCCLGVLPALRDLVISESALPNAHAIITDDFLQGLVFKCSTTSLVPELDSLYLYSRLRFTDDVYLEMVASRAEAVYELYDDNCFVTYLWWSATPEREVSSETMDHLSELISDSMLLFRSGADDSHFSPPSTY